MTLAVGGTLNTTQQPLRDLKHKASLFVGIIVFMRSLSFMLS